MMAGGRENPDTQAGGERPNGMRPMSLLLDHGCPYVNSNHNRKVQKMKRGIPAKNFFFKKITEKYNFFNVY
jgi:hypothetical protein